MTFISKSSAKTVKESDEFKSLAVLLESASAMVAEKKDRNERARAEREVKVLKDKLSSMVESPGAKGSVDQWILDGMKTWIDAYLPGITNLRVYPFTDSPDEHLIGHLKRHCFEDSDSSSFHFTYGSFPTENLTVLGIVTSVPDEAGEQFDPLVELRAESAPAGLAVERGFRGVFRGFDGIEKFIRTARFPRIMVLPLTVYRAVEPKVQSKA